MLVTQEAVVDNEAGAISTRQVRFSLSVERLGNANAPSLAATSKSFSDPSSAAPRNNSILSRDSVVTEVSKNSIATAITMSIAQRQLVQLRILQRQYLQLVDPLQLRWPDAQVLKETEVQAWMFSHMFDEASVKSPPPERYQLRVLKLLISKLERSIVDPEEDVWFPIFFKMLFDISAICHALYRSQLCPFRYCTSDRTRMQEIKYTSSC